MHDATSFSASHRETAQTQQYRRPRRSSSREMTITKSFGAFKSMLPLLLLLPMISHAAFLATNLQATFDDEMK